jgi:hypothetical protein
MVYHQVHDVWVCLNTFRRAPGCSFDAGIWCDDLLRGWGAVGVINGYDYGNKTHKLGYHKAYSAGDTTT